MKLHINFSLFALASVVSLFGVSANSDTDTSATTEPNVSSIRGGKSNTTRLLTTVPAQLEEITGAFDVVVSARFDNLAGGWYQRVFDFGNGAGHDNVWLGQVGNSNDMAFETIVGTKWIRCTAHGVIHQGELATWKAGVDSNGLQWIEKNGHRVCNIHGQIPRNVHRAHKLLGASNFPHDTPLKGAVIGIDITNAGQVRDGALLNNPKQIRGAFTISVQARFDAPQGGHWQRVFDFGNGSGKDNVWLGQLANTNDMVLEVWRDGVMKRLVAPGAIIAGQLATWRVGINAHGLMWINKDNKRIAQVRGTVPAAVHRSNNFLGSSNWPSDSPLDGVVLGLQVW